MERDGDGSLRPEAAFALLGEELRLAILFALHEIAEQSGNDRESVAYSELQEAVEEPDSGRFNYHLSRLTGTFVRKNEDGYSMRQSGKSVVRAVLSGTFTDDPHFGPVTVDEECFRCGEPIAVSYEDELVFTQCSGCEGTLELNYCPPGTLSVLTYPPAGLDGRNSAEVVELAHTRFEREVGMFAADTCPECGGPASHELVVCPDHDAGETTLCGTCRLSIGAVARLTCTVCGHGRMSPPLLAYTHHPDVLDVLNAHGPTTDAWTRFDVAMTRPYDIVDPAEPTIAYPGPSNDCRIHVAADLRLSVE